ncbi:DUF3016 domain-containing protein [Alkalimonas delamerensis]|uniref:DUF3016 domain-containing protein n=1 Tax=Alkalimonas delamerensis TaxID=265981 RepID=A0ABT9GKQ1_9GAMM|nr:DUF3016 domain-containing protein [Alkalimonas delamerensis]MDP4527551.1 DUF3016 domain-containing protein [Alkalimonas delamerensis]
MKPIWRKLTMAVALSGLLGVSVHALADESSNLSLSFQEPEKFTDIRPANESRARFRERTLAGFERIFQEFAAELPEGYRWQVTVTDIDLAGDVNPMYSRAGQDIRVVKDIYSPRVAFSHELRDAYGAQVAAGDVNLRDMGFMQSPRMVGPRHQELRYEYTMLKRWFERDLLAEVEAHQAKLPKVSD